MAAVRETPPEERPRLAGDLFAALRLLERLERLETMRCLGEALAGYQQRPETPKDVWITPKRAAEIAGFPMATDEDQERARRRIYQWAWARGKQWASRPNRKTLLINEPVYRQWLASWLASRR